MRMTKAAVAQQLTTALGLASPPVAITFTNESPTVPGPASPVPAGCSFWELGTKAAIATNAEDHQLCSIGVHTHNLRGASAAHGRELTTALEAMTGLGYVTADEVAGIPVMGSSFKHVIYGPLATTDGDASVVLILANATQSLTITEAVARVDGAPPIALGRPACALVPYVMNSGIAAASLGCCGARAYLDTLNDGAVLWAFPATRIDDYASAVQTLVDANGVLSMFHNARRKAVEGGEQPTVQQTLDLLS
jgi:uncharacterized protein (DUF169 family)